MSEKQDTNFGKTMLDLARETYGEDFMFNQCTITVHSEEEFTVQFDMREIKIEMTEGETPPKPTEMSNFDKLSNLERNTPNGTMDFASDR